MTYRGHVHNGTIILDESTTLPEGMEVVVLAVVDKALPGEADVKSHHWMGRYKGMAEVPELDVFQAIRKEMWPEK